MAKSKRPKPENFAELLRELGDVPLERIRIDPPPGTATAKDVIAAEALPQKRLCELVDGVLIEKMTTARDSVLTGKLMSALGNFVEEKDQGVILGPDGMLRILPGMVRLPDVSYISWDRMPRDRFPSVPIPSLSPDLAIEVISPGNTQGEMARKLKDYFRSGVRLVWLVYPKMQTAEVYTDPETKTAIPKDGAVEGGDVLPGFRLSLKQLFDSLTRRKAV